MILQNEAVDGHQFATMKSPTSLGSWISCGRLFSWKLVVIAFMFLILLMEWKRFNLVIQQPMIIRQQHQQEWNFQAGQRQLLKKLASGGAAGRAGTVATTTTAPDLKIPPASQDEKTFGDSGRSTMVLQA